MSCTVDLKNINQKTSKKCSSCKEFLESNYLFEQSYREYDNISTRGSRELIYIPDSISVPKNKTTFMNGDDNRKLHQNKFCFIGMKKGDIERRFSHEIKKFFGFVSTFDDNKCFISYHYNVGTLEEDGTTTVTFANSPIFYFDVINGDTIYSPEPKEIATLRKCLDQEGVNYKGR